MVKKTLLTIYFCLVTVVMGCALNGVGIQGKIRPEWSGIDPKVAFMYEEYRELAKLNNIKFTNSVTIGFKRIKSSSIIGVCHDSLHFKEIDLDIDFWKYSTTASKYALLYHELTHCMCGRDHDYASDKPYKEITLKSINLDSILVLKKITLPGYMEDGCPLSLMTPELLDDGCFLQHYDHYIKEMFERCTAW